MTASPDRRVAELVERVARPLGVERFGFCPLPALSGFLECRGKGRLPKEGGSAIVLLLPYQAGEFPGRNVARYALCDDYHTIAGNILEQILCPLGEAFPGEAFLPFVTRNTAESLDLFPRKGAIAPGADADLLLLDQSLHVASTMARGRWMLREGEMRFEPVYQD